MPIRTRWAIVMIILSFVGLFPVVGSPEGEKEPGDFYKTKTDKQNLGLILNYPFLTQKRKPVKSVIVFSDGKLISEHEYYPNGSLKKIVSLTKRKMTEDSKQSEILYYDKQGKLLKVELRNWYSGKLHMMTRRVFQYHSIGVLSGDKSQLYFMNKKNNKSKKYQQDLTLTISRKYFYDDQNRLVRAAVIHEEPAFNEGSYIPVRTIKGEGYFFYDKKNRLKKYLFKSPDQEMDYRYYYNQNNELLRIEIRDHLLRHDYKFNATVRYIYE